MKKTTRAIQLALGLAVSLGLAAGGARAQDAWPTKRITFVIGFAVGGFADTVGRIIANKLGERLNQSIIVQNLEGAGGNAAARHVTQQPADGYTFLVTTTGLAINETLYKNKQFSAAALVPIAIPVTAPESLVTNPKSGIKTFPDLIAAAKEGRAFMGTPGSGSGSHIAAEYFFKKIAHIDVKHIPFQGGNPAMQALLAGDINVFASTATAATIPPILRGELVGLAVASAQRDPALPAVPTYAELGYKEFVASSWTGLFARTGTPDAVVDRLNTEINEVMKDPDVQKRMQTIGLITMTRTRPETAAFFKDEVGRWALMVEATGLSM